MVVASGNGHGRYVVALRARSILGGRWRWGWILEAIEKAWRRKAAVTVA